MSLLLSMLSRSVITFLPRSKCHLISWLQSPSAVILEPRKIKSDTVSTVSPSISHEVMGPDTMIFVFWTLSFKPTFSLSSITFIKRLFSSSSRSAIRVVSSAYLRLLIFLPPMLFPDYASYSPVFLMMYSAYKLNKQGGNVQPWHWHTPFLRKWLLASFSLLFWFPLFSSCSPLSHPPSSFLCVTLWTSLRDPDCGELIRKWLLASLLSPLLILPLLLLVTSVSLFPLLFSM